ADQGDDLPGLQIQVDALQHRLAGKLHGDIMQTNQAVGHGDSWQARQRPSTSTVCPSTAKPRAAALLTIAWLIADCCSSMAAWHCRQMRNCPWCTCPGWLQPTKAFSEAMRCTKPCSSRKSSAR